MGYYIDKLADDTPLPAKDKADFLLTHVPGTRQVHPPPARWQEDLVCVVENGTFDAAGYVYNQQELFAFAQPDGRRKSWLIVPDAGGLTWYGRVTPKEERNFER